MTDLCLKFPDEAAAQSALYADEVPRFHASIDTIGTIRRPIGDMDAEGSFLTAALPGWHVNLRGTFKPEQMDALAKFVVTPAQPVRVWA